MVRKQRGANLLSNLPQLQNLIKRDPSSYKEEFEQQLQHFEASLAIFELKPDSEAKEFGEAIGFLAQVARCYPERSARFPGQLMDLVQRHYPVLDSELRRTIVQALILLRSRGVVSNVTVMPLFFRLFRCRDKKLRTLLYKHIVSDVKSANKGRHRDHKLNRALQGFMYTMLTAADAQDKHGEGAIAAKKSLDVCIELYRKKVWTDAKAVNVIVQACFSPINKIMLTAVQFFLNPYKRREGDDGSDDDGDSEAEAGGGKTGKGSVNLRLVQHQSNINKKSKYRKRVLEKTERKFKRNEARRLGQLDSDDEDDDDKKKKKGQQGAFDALSLVHDAQGFAEKLFARAYGSATATKRGGSTVDRFSVRLQQLKLVSRLIGHHQLQVMAFYPFLQRYLQPHQAEVTQILALLANAAHALAPPDVLQPLVRTIADNFVSDHCAPEVMCAGLNTIRAVAARQPLAVDPDLLNDLVQYRKHKDKGVMMAAQGLRGLYRKINPELLLRRDRGRDATQKLIAGEGGTGLLGFGEQRASEGVDGAELLALDEDSGEESLELEDDVDESSEDTDEAPEEEDQEDQNAGAEEPVAVAAVKDKRRVDMERLLTNEDFARIERLKRQRGASGQQQQAKRARRAETVEKDESGPESESESEGEVKDWDIVGDYHARRRHRKATHEERLEAIRAGREGREKFGSSKAKREKEGRSLSNREKRKTKNFKMIAHKRSVVSKGKRSLIQKRRELRKHVTKQKKRGH
ncbi:Severe Depolymerization of Actin [Coemansia sp. RSA 552]|nr:Severe Depolymerization of Actin [Coemansia sp. RSA 552]